MRRCRLRMDDPMRVGRQVEIPLREITIRASRSSGPGGQHANSTDSRIEAVFDVAASAVLSEEQKRRIISRCGPRVVATAQDTRNQTRNRELALRRLRDSAGVLAARFEAACRNAADEVVQASPHAGQGSPIRAQAPAPGPWYRRGLTRRRDPCTGRLARSAPIRSDPAPDSARLAAAGRARGRQAGAPECRATVCSRTTR